MKAFAAAFQFLTVLPVPLSTGEQELRRSVLFFPLVGLLLGGAVAALDVGLVQVLPVGPASVLTVLALLFFTGGLHIDGLADTADGFFSSRPRERILEIMKDSRSGPMAIAAVTGLLILKTTVVASLPPACRWQALILMVLAGRVALVVQMNALPYARPDGGLARVFCAGKAGWVRRLESLVAIAILGGAGWGLLQIPGILAGAGALPVMLLFGFYCWRKIGGFTGDTLGAGCELTETVPGLVLVAWAHAGGAY